MILVRTHYLDWERALENNGARMDADWIWQRALEGALGTGTGPSLPIERPAYYWVPMDTGDDWLRRCVEFWQLGLYVPGPPENGLTALLDVEQSKHHLAVCDVLWAIYNADERPDGQARRSMSVGDVVQIDCFYYLARGTGWIGLELPPNPNTQGGSRVITNL